VSIAAPRLLRVPAYESGLTLGDFLVPIRLGERASARQRNIALVVMGVVLIAASARVAVALPGTAVPLTGQTFGVLATATALGFRRGIAAIGLYLLLGFLLPVFAGGTSGIDRVASFSQGRLVFGATGGYLLGFLVAGGLVGRLAELGWDRHWRGALAAMLIGNALLYVIALPWLAAALSLTPAQAVAQGLTPFIIGDAVKFALATVAFPLGWWIVGRRPSDR
jgi:biotin transport system substrate-specific component